MKVVEPHQAFLDAYQKIHVPFTKYCSAHAFGIMATEDLVQEAVLSTLNAFEGIADKKKLLSYMIGTVHNIVRNQKRRQKFRGNWNEQQMAFISAKVTDPELLVDIQYLYECLQRLPKEQREALVLFEISGCSIKEIADVQGCREGAIKTRLHRARKQLRELFEENITQNSMSLADSMTAFISILF